MTLTEFFNELKQHDMKATFRGKPCQVISVQYETPHDLGMSIELHSALSIGRTTTVSVRYFNEFLQEWAEDDIMFDTFIEHYQNV